MKIYYETVGRLNKFLITFVSSTAINSLETKAILFYHCNMSCMFLALNKYSKNKLIKQSPGQKLCSAKLGFSSTHSILQLHTQGRQKNVHVLRLTLAYEFSLLIKYFFKRGHYWKKQTLFPMNRTLFLPEGYVCKNMESSEHPSNVK